MADLRSTCFFPGLAYEVCIHINSKDLSPVSGPHSSPYSSEFWCEIQTELNLEQISSARLLPSALRVPVKLGFGFLLLCLTNGTLYTFNGTRYHVPCREYLPKLNTCSIRRPSSPFDYYALSKVFITTGKKPYTMTNKSCNLYKWVNDIADGTHQLSTFRLLQHPNGF